MGQLSEANEQFLDQSVADGHFPSRDDAINLAVDLLRVESEIHGLVAGSLAAFDQGDFVDYGDSELENLEEHLLQRLQARIDQARIDACDGQ